MAKELWIGVDANGEAFIYGMEPIWRDREFSSLEFSGLYGYLGDYTHSNCGILPGHKAKLVLDEASVTKGGA